MPKYYPHYKISGTYTPEIETETEYITEILNKATESYENTDFGEASNIDAELMCIEDENNNVIWEANNNIGDNDADEPSNPIAAEMVKAMFRSMED